MTVLVTGGAGFIGSHFVLRHVAQNPDDTLIVLDTLTYAADKSFLDPVIQRIRFIEGDIADVEILEQIASRYGIDTIVNFAAETHVDRSIKNIVPFIHSNILGVQALVELLKRHPEILLLHVSTDEVYGDLKDSDAPFDLQSPLNPSSPYSATKAAGDLLLRASARTFGIRARITRCTNNYGPHQDTSKLLPVIITSALAGKKIPIYGEGKQKRDWLYVTDHTDAIEKVLTDGEDGKIYLVSADDERANIDVAMTVLDVLGKSHDLISFVEDRPGHDWRYALDNSSVRKLGWKPAVSFAKGVEETVAWFRRKSTAR
ncbi:MAG: dTDP-glucose 4,6-dehydratase [Candidatus Peregrinibacteria bacterium]|nr:dTDP-glucose 4,6-dehydratase [Candidatus Peregrinibacteria bacterium]